MRDFSPAMLEALDDPLVVMGTHTVITRRDGLVLRFVDLDEPSVVNGQTYYPHGASERTAIRLSAGIASDTVELKGLLSSDALSRKDLLAGLLDYADLEVFLAFVGRPDLPSLTMMRGKFGEMKVDLGRYTIQVNSLAHAFTHNIGVRTSPTCRAAPGDAQCRLDLKKYRLSGVITSVADARTFTVEALSGRAAQYAGGEFRILSGAAAGQASEIRGGSGSAVSLYVPLTITPAAGDAVRLDIGCPRTREACEKLGNIANFRGEPDLPGDDIMLSPAVSANG